MNCRAAIRSSANSYIILQYTSAVSFAGVGYFVECTGNTDLRLKLSAGIALPSTTSGLYAIDSIWPGAVSVYLGDGRMDGDYLTFVDTATGTKYKLTVANGTVIPIAL
jgi:hypothetical protein